MKYIVTNTEIRANRLQGRIFARHLRRIARNGRLIRDSDKIEVDITGLTDDQLNTNFVIYGRRKGIRRLNEGKTVRWAIPQQRLDGNWVIEWDASFDRITTSIPHTIEEYSESWFDQSL